MLNLCKLNYSKLTKIYIGYIISKARKLQFCKQPFEIIQGHIALTNKVQFTNFLEQHLKNKPISRTGYQF